jgi:hypothetical protein
MTSYDSLEVTYHGDVLVNGSPPASALHREEAEAQLLTIRGTPSTCEYCGYPLRERCWRREVGAWGERKCAVLIACDQCRFWEWYRCDSMPCSLGHPDQNHLQCASKLREFEGDLPDSIGGELAQYLRRRTDAWCRFTPAGLEQVVSDILRANYQQAEVIHVGRPDDGGVDVIFVDAGGPTWLVQVKRRSKPGSAEGVSTLRNLLGAMILERSLRGLVVSTADRFSMRARATAGAARQLGYEIRLADRGVLDRMLEPLLPVTPWLDVMKELDEEVARGYSAEFIPCEQLSFFEEPT